MLKRVIVKNLETINRYGLPPPPPPAGGRKAVNVKPESKGRFERHTGFSPFGGVRCLLATGLDFTTFRDTFRGLFWG